MIDVKIILEAGECNGFFDLCILDQDKNILQRPILSSGKNEINFRCHIPNQLSFKLSNKNNKRDTVVDPLHGNVVRDKYIKVIDFYVDNKPLDRNRTKQMFTLVSENHGTIQSAYWGFNGTVDLDMPYKNSFEFHLSNLV